MPKLELFRNRNFINMWAAQIFGAYATGTLTIGIAILADQGKIISDLKGLSISVGLVIFLAYVPGALVGPIAGAFSDLFDKKKIMVITNLIRFLLSIILLFYWDLGIFSYVMIFIISIVGKFFFPAEASTIPIVVKKRNILLANTLFAVVAYSSSLIGMFFAGVLLGLFGANTLFIVSSALFGISAILLLFLRSSNLSLDSNPDVTFSIKGIKLAINLTKESTKSIYGYVKKHSFVRGIILHLFIVNVFVWTIMALIFRISREIFDSDTAGVSYYIVLPGALGLGLGVILMNKRFSHWTRPKLVELGVRLTALGLFISSVAGLMKYLFHFDGTMTAIAIIGIFMIGYGAVYIVIPAQAMLNEDVDKDFLGRVYGLWLAVVYSLAAFPPLILSLIADQVPNISIFMVVLSVFVIYYSTKVLKLLSKS